MFELVHVILDILVVVREICDVEAFFAEMLEEEVVEFIIVGCYVESGRETGSVLILRHGVLVGILILSRVGIYLLKLRNPWPGAVVIVTGRD